MEPGQQFEQEHSECVGDDLMIFWNTVAQRVKVVELGVSDGGGNRIGGVKVKVGTDTAKSAEVMVAGF